MSTTVLNAAKFSAIALGLMAFNSLSVDAQTNNSDSFKFDRIELQETNWNFSSEDENISVGDDLGELQDYSISDSDDADIRITDEEPRFSNQGELEDFSINTDVFEY